MKEGPDIATLAALIGDPARANMLTALMQGRALTARELADEAGVTASTASGHLGRLIEAGLVLAVQQGRHRYHRLAGPEVAEAIEVLIGLAARTGRLRTRPGPRDPAMRRARVCYDHLAGAAAVELFDAYRARGFLAAGPDGLALTEAGHAHLSCEGIDTSALARGKRPLCRACVDWSERRPHLAGVVGAALLDLVLKRGWARRVDGSRTVLFTPPGERAFAAFVAGPATPGDVDADRAAS
jgi:DNA-binding transcriptional ArsR family regulator